MLPLPFLGSLFAATGCEPAAAHPLVVMRAASGVAQEDGKEPEQWWPHELGALSPTILRDDNADRCVSELADFADHLLMVRGTAYPFKATRELHAGGGNQLLTAAQPGPLTDSVMTFAQGESIDNFIARQGTRHAGEPLTLYAGRRDNYGEEVLSYRGPGLLRGAESDPWKVYQRLTGLSPSVGLRPSVNDMVLDQLQAIRASSRLSQFDRDLLDLHTDSIRDFELMAARLSKETEEAMRDLDGRSADDAVSLDVARLQCDLIALVLSVDHVRAITLQIGDRLDRCKYVIDGETLPGYHWLSHRLVAEEDLGSFGSSWEMHAAVNRLHLQVFHYLLERLDERGLLETSVAVFCSDIATGSHRFDQIPWIIAGAGDGTLRQGAYVDAATPAGDATHNKLLNTLLHATGHREADGSPIAFGDESLEPGLLDVMLA